MKEENFNPEINAIVSIRHLAMGVSKKWVNIKTIGNTLNNELTLANEFINLYGSSKTIENWNDFKLNYQTNLASLKKVLDTTVEKIKTRNTYEISEDWNSYKQFSNEVLESLKSMHRLGTDVIPENKNEAWELSWDKIYLAHEHINNEAKACSFQLELMEAYQPEEISEMTDTILKHIPLNYSIEAANKYQKEYLEAYAALKKEASQKKNLWDRFLDLLAGGTQQSPAQRVMMQRWVNGEKGDNTL